VPAITDWLLRTLHAARDASAMALARSPCGGSGWLAALNLSPGDVHVALQRNNFLAAVGQTKSNLVQVNLLANTDLRSVDEFQKLIVAERGGAIVRLSDVARVELGAEEADRVAKYSEQEAPRGLAAGRRKRDRGGEPAARGDGTPAPDAAKRH